MHRDRARKDGLLSERDGVQRGPQLIRYIEGRRQHRERWVGVLDDVGHFPQMEVPALILDEALAFFAPGAGEGLKAPVVPTPSR